jgi:YidC/Oxa1 family membrane protein insertase
VITQIWNLVIVNPMMDVLVFIYSIVGNYGIAIIIFTFLLKLLTLPFSLQQLRSMRKQQEAAPELAALQKKYGKDRERMAQEQMKLYKEKGINPLGGCLPMLIPWPLFVAFYQSVSLVISNQPEQYMDMAQHILPRLASFMPVGEKFLWMNLSLPDPLYVLPVLAVVTTWVQQKMMTTQGADAQAQSMNQTMGLIMPLFMGWITLNFAAGLAIYWVFFNIAGIIQQYFVAGWGDLGKLLPAPILRRFPGPVPVASTAPAVPAAKQSTPRRSSATSNDDSATVRTRRRRSAEIALAVRDDGSDGEEPDATTVAESGSASSLPSKRNRKKKSGTRVR